MRPLLASLALLLLALCKSASAGAATWNDAVSAADSALSLSAATRDAQGAKLVNKWATAKVKLVPLMGNSLHALMLKALDKYKTLPEYYKKALDNGVLCELAQAEIVKKVAQAQYGADTVPDADKPTEKALAKSVPNMPIDCDGTTADPCLCTEGKPLLFCLAQKLKTGTKVTCRDEAIAALTTAAKKGLAKRMDEGVDQTSDGDESFAGLTKNESPEMAQLFCDAIDSTSEPLVSAVYAADALAWTLDNPMVAKLLLNGELDLAKGCATAAGSATPLNKCVCAKKIGADICMASLGGQAMKEKNYLDCGATPSFKTAAKDGVEAAVMAAVNGGSPSSETTSVPVVPAAGNDTVVTTAAPSDSAAASSLLVPLAAAAAMLLRH